MLPRATPYEDDLHYDTSLRTTAVVAHIHVSWVGSITMHYCCCVNSCRSVINAQPHTTAGYRNYYRSRWEELRADDDVLFWGNILFTKNSPQAVGTPVRSAWGLGSKVLRDVGQQQTTIKNSTRLISYQRTEQQKSNTS